MEGNCSEKRGIQSCDFPCLRSHSYIFIVQSINSVVYPTINLVKTDRYMGRRVLVGSFVRIRPSVHDAPRGDPASIRLSVSYIGLCDRHWRGQVRSKIASFASNQPFDLQQLPRIIIQQPLLYAHPAAAASLACSTK